MRTCVLDALHANDIEIVSPTFVNQRRLSEKAVISKPEQAPLPPTKPDEPAPEDLMFDKAENAEQRESLDKISPEIKELEAQLAKADGENRGELEAQIESLCEQRDSIEQNLAESSEEAEDRN